MNKYLGESGCKGYYIIDITTLRFCWRGFYKAALIHKQWGDTARLYSESKEDGFRVL